MVIMDRECTHCNGSGTIGCSSYSLQYIGPGPVPEDARGVVGLECDECQGSGVIAVDCATGDDA